MAAPVSQLPAARVPERAPTPRSQVIAVGQLVLQGTVPEIPAQFLRRRLALRQLAPRIYEVMAALDLARPDMRLDRAAQLIAAQDFNGLLAPFDRRTLIAHLRDQGYPVIDLTDNEVAKVHIRHMVGGRAAGTESESLYRFEFPERPGALLRFLSRMGEDWNISMFHYRNHGSAYGRVLVGMQVPAADRATFDAFLSELGYRYEEETNNPAYELFLSASG